MTAKVKIDGEERYAIFFPKFDDTSECIEAMEEGLWDVLEVLVTDERAKRDVPASALGQLVKICKMLSKKDSD